MGMPPVMQLVYDPREYVRFPFERRVEILERLEPVELERLWRGIDAIRADDGVPSGVRREVWHQWRRKLIAIDRDPDTLARDSRDEVERFWAHTIPGLGGCLLWDGPTMFRFRRRKTDPARWAWRYDGREIPKGPNYRIVSRCGAVSCVNVEHLAMEQVDRRRFSDERMIGALQVLAMRLGRTPLAAEWDKAHLRPTAEVPRRRWGSWGAFCRAAGLEPEPVSERVLYRATDDDIFSRMREMAVELGRAPAMREWNGSGQRPWAQTLQKRFGGWTPLLLAAGVTPNQAAKNHRTPGQLLQSLRDYHDEHGKVPTQRQWEKAGALPSVGTFRKYFGSFNEAVVAAGMPVRVQEHPLRKYALGLRRDEDGFLIADETIKQVERRLYKQAL